MRFSDELIQQLKADGFGITPQRYPEVFKRQKSSPKKLSFGGDFVINRYPLLAAIGYVIAKQKYPEKTAKSLGIALANQYAAWKNTHGWASKGKEKPSRAEKERLEFKDEDVDILNFCGETFVIKNGIVIGAYYRKVWTKAEPSQFDFKVVSAFNRIKKGGFQFICREIKKALKKEGKNAEGFLEAPFGKHFFQFWKRNRDYLRQRSFWS